MITDHPYIATLVFMILCLAAGFWAGLGYRRLEARQLRKSNETLRIMLNGALFEFPLRTPNRTRQSATSASKRSKTSQSTGWAYTPAQRRSKLPPPQLNAGGVDE